VTLLFWKKLPKHWDNPQFIVNPDDGAWEVPVRFQIFPK
jgi:hypothetical protein